MKNNAAVCSAIAAAISATMAFASLYYNREVSQASVSLTDVKVNAQRIAPDKLKINFLFIFHNVGTETLALNDLQLGHFDFAQRIFEQVGERLVPNPTHAGGIFNYSTAFSVGIDPHTPNEALGEILPETVGRHALILKVGYKGTSLLSRLPWQSVKSEKYFLGYKGFGAVYQLTRDEYQEMEVHLPKEFHLDF